MNGLLRFYCGYAPRTQAERTVYWFLKGDRFRYPYYVNCRCATVNLHPPE